MTPLADQLRPLTFGDIVGQDHIIGPEGLLTKTLSNGHPISILLWGPPGCGKTTIGKLYAKAFDAHFFTFSGTYSGSVEIKKLLKEMKESPLTHRRRILFIDEIHRFNKAQQDIFLPYLEEGSAIIVGATTENPSFALNDALLSRLRVFELNPLKPENTLQILDKALNKAQLNLTSNAKNLLIKNCSGDGRHLLNSVETIQTCAPNSPIDIQTLQKLLTIRPTKYDNHGDSHYNLISALHKSVRGSDPDAALYWLARILSGGEDFNFVARRLLRMASEDIGLADPHALQHVLTAWEGIRRLGPKEGELLLAQATIYLALCPKSNAAYTAYTKAQELAQETTDLPPPKQILNAPTSLMKNHGYGQGYLYDHDQPNAFSGQNYFPPDLPRPSFYSPVPRGFERDLQKRLAYFHSLRSQLTNN